MEEYRFGGGAGGSSSGGKDSADPPQSGSRRYRNSTSSSRRASLPPFLSPMAPSPTSAAFRHRPSIASSITTNGTSTSNSTSNDDTFLQRHPNEGNIHHDRDLPGMYSGLKSYTFGSSAPQQPVASSSSSSSTNLHPLLSGSKSSRRSLSRRSSMNASGIYVGPSHGTPIYPGEYDNDTEMYAGGSDVGSAYSPEDDRDALFAASQRRWERAMATAPDHMDVDGPEGGRRLSRDQGSMYAENMARSYDKKRERNGHRRTSTVSGNVAHQGGRDGQENQEIVTDDEEALARNTGRSKMRAIDDGTRRPSLPINAASHPSLAPLAVSPFQEGYNLFAPRPSQFDIRMSIGSATTGPPTPRGISFAATATTSPIMRINTHIPIANPIPADHDSSSASPSSHFPSSASSSDSPHQYPPAPKPLTGNRPRSRSNRAAKPLPVFPLPPTDPNNWVAPWSSQSAAAVSLSPKKTAGTVSESLPVGLPPPNINPFLSSPPQATASVNVRNPFVKNGAGVVRTPSPPQSRASPTLQSASASIASSLTSNAPGMSAQPAVAVAPTSSATADFDLAFILSGAVADASQAPHVSDVGTYTARKGSIATSLLEDSFTRFVNKFDEDFGERRDQWSYQIERASSSSTDGQGDYWRCDNMGRYWVGRETAVDEGHGGGGYDGFTSENSITVQICPPEELSKAQGKLRMEDQEYFNSSSGGGADAFATPRPSLVHYGDGGQLSPNMTPSQRRSNVRVQVKKHARAPAFTLYLGPRGPRSLSVSRPSILLAPKAYQLHSSTPSSKPKVSSMRSKSSMSASSASMSDSGMSGMSGMSASPPGTRSNSPPEGPPNWGSLSASSTTLVGSSSHHGYGSGAGAGAPLMHRRDPSRPTLVTAGEQQKRSPHPHLAIPPVPSRGNSPNIRYQNSSVLPPDPATVSLDQMSVAAATGRLTSVHKQAFDTLSPEDGQAVLEHLKNRTSLGIRLKRAFGGRGGDGHGNSLSLSRGGPESIAMMNFGGSLNSHSSSGHGHNDHQDGKDARTSSPQAPGSGRHNKDDKNHHTGPATLEAAFEPPWMLMTPMYVREAVVAAERSMYTGFAQLGLAAPHPGKKAGGKKAGLNGNTSALYDSPTAGAAMRRNSVLDTIPNEAMCMVLPLWDLTLDIQEDRRKRHKDDLDLDLDDLDEEDEEAEDLNLEDVSSTLPGSQDPEATQRAQLLKEMVRRRKFMPPPKVERKYLLAYYVPFNAKRQSLAPTPTAKSASAASHENRSSKKRNQASGPSTSGRASMKRRNSGSGQPTSAKPHGVRSFRVVSRILTAAELRDSGLSPPRNIVDPKRMQQQSTAYYHSSLNYQRMDRRLSTSSLLGDATPSAFSAVIAVCHDRRKGVEFIPEGLDSLGLCGDGTVMGSTGNIEKLPPLFPPAHMVPVLERLTPPLNAVGKQVVEMIWAGCLALTELGL
ncbi:hypothetical protein FRB96_005094 [Tulasnella sp. 330]|nr:hypothetical protein FRB96_005094 [Tulasnella sp. 330]